MRMRNTTFLSSTERKGARCECRKQRSDLRIDKELALEDAGKKEKVYSE